MLLDLICLANARKRSERCVACLRADGSGWIRLVSNSPHGELNFSQRTLGAHGEPQNFDLIRAEVIRASPLLGQPENWLIADRPWKLLQRPAAPEFHAVLTKHVHRENGIFGSTADRLAVANFRRQPVSASLAVLKPQNTRFVHEILGSKKRVRALFDLGHNSFNLSVTDPPFEQQIKGPSSGYLLSRITRHS